ncbi:ComEA family DNA-binding protein [Paenibacillus sp. WLX1005]|uniref:ComEA family DNA-binding protein n=1 Tax=Paenibacillus sp. WLX1005 TaxID=3243766 RepID=UPI003983E74C
MMKTKIMIVATILSVLGVGLIWFGAAQQPEQGTEWVQVNERAAATLEPSSATTQAGEQDSNIEKGSSDPLRNSSSFVANGADTGTAGTSSNTGISGVPTSTDTNTVTSKQDTIDTSTNVSTIGESATGDPHSSSASTVSSQSNQTKSSTNSSELDTHSASSVSEGKISINRAGLAELTELPGIGDKKAQAIIDYRNVHGAFQHVNELDNVKGIGSKMLAKLLPYVSL